MDPQYGELIEPPPEPFTFGAPGWYILAALLLLTMAGLAWLMVWRYRSRRYRRLALKMIKALIQQSGDRTMLLYRTNMLMKNVAINVYGRDTVAGIRTEEWIAFLNRTLRVKLFDLSDSALLRSLYGYGDLQPIDGFVAKAKEWIKKHKRIKSPDLALRNSL